MRTPVFVSSLLIQQIRILLSRLLCPKEKVTHIIDGIIVMHPSIPVFDQHHISFTQTSHIGNSLRT